MESMEIGKDKDKKKAEMVDDLVLSLYCFVTLALFFSQIYFCGDMVLYFSVSVLSNPLFYNCHSWIGQLCIYQ